MFIYFTLVGRGVCDMSRLMSVLEKFNVVEKIDEVQNKSVGRNISEVSNSNTDNKPIKSETTPKLSEADNILEETKTSNVRDFETYKNVQASVKYDTNVPIGEIYSMFNIENSNINTIFMLGNFINALPESLPADIKKNSVINILNASNTDLDHLISDGEKRLEAVNQFANSYSNHISNTIMGYKSEITKLKNTIDHYYKLIENNEELLEEQNNIIRYETQKIHGIVSFFKESK
jgi:hypothetical protein